MTTRRDRFAFLPAGLCQSFSCVSLGKKRSTPCPTETTHLIKGGRQLRSNAAVAAFDYPKLFSQEDLPISLSPGPVADSAQTDDSSFQRFIHPIYGQFRKLTAVQFPCSLHCRPLAPTRRRPNFPSIGQSEKGVTLPQCRPMAERNANSNW